MRFEHHAGIDLHARIWCANADTFALQIGEGFDARIGGGDDLADVRPETHHGAQIGRRLLPLIGAEGFDGLDDGVRHGDGHFALPGEQRVDVFCCRTGRCRRSAVAELADQSREGATDGEINTAGGSGEHGDVVVTPLDLLRRRLGRCDQRNGQGKGNQAEKAASHFFHFRSSLWLSISTRWEASMCENTQPKTGCELPIFCF